MGDVVDLKPARLEENHEFVVDLCRYAENILTEKAVKKKYRFDDATWEKLGDDDKLVEAIEAEKIRRIRDGSSKREKAQLLVVKAPDVVASIMLDDNANARHRIDASKTLNDFAANGPEAMPASDRFQITIVLNGDVEHYDKSIEVNANDTADLHSSGTAPPVIAAIAKNKPKAKPKGDDDGGII